MGLEITQIVISDISNTIPTTVISGDSGTYNSIISNCQTVCFFFVSDSSLDGQTIKFNASLWTNSSLPSNQSSYYETSVIAGAGTYATTPININASEDVRSVEVEMINDKCGKVCIEFFNRTDLEGYIGSFNSNNQNAFINGGLTSGGSAGSQTVYSSPSNLVGHLWTNSDQATGNISWFNQYYSNSRFLFYNGYASSDFCVSDCLKIKIDKSLNFDPERVQIILIDTTNNNQATDFWSNYGGEYFEINGNNQGYTDVKDSSSYCGNHGFDSDCVLFGLNTSALTLGNKYRIIVQYYSYSNNVQDVTISEELTLEACTTFTECCPKIEGSVSDFNNEYDLRNCLATSVNQKLKYNICFDLDADFVACVEDCTGSPLNLPTGLYFKITGASPFVISGQVDSNGDWTTTNDSYYNTFSITQVGTKLCFDFEISIPINYAGQTKYLNFELFYTASKGCRYNFLVELCLEVSEIEQLELEIYRGNQLFGLLCENEEKQKMCFELPEDCILESLSYFDGSINEDSVGISATGLTIENTLVIEDVTQAGNKVCFYLINAYTLKQLTGKIYAVVRKDDCEVLVVPEDSEFNCNDLEFSEDQGSVDILWNNYIGSLLVSWYQDGNLIGSVSTPGNSTNIQVPACESYEFTVQQQTTKGLSEACTFVVKSSCPTYCISLNSVYCYWSADNCVTFVREPYLDLETISISGPNGSIDMVDESTEYCLTDLELERFCFDLTLICNGEETTIQKCIKKKEDVIDSCVTPSNLTVDIGINTIEICWDDVNAECYEVRFIKANDYNQSSPDNSNWIGPFNVTALCYMLTNLEACTDYIIQVRSKCPPCEYSDWAETDILSTLGCDLCFNCDDFKVSLLYSNCDENQETQVTLVLLDFPPDCTDDFITISGAVTGTYILNNGSAVLGNYTEGTYPITITYCDCSLKTDIIILPCNTPNCLEFLSTTYLFGCSPLNDPNGETIVYFFWDWNGQTPTATIDLTIDGNTTNGVSYLTTSYGSYVIVNLPEGQHTIQVCAESCCTDVITIDVPDCECITDQSILTDWWIECVDGDYIVYYTVQDSVPSIGPFSVQLQGMPVPCSGFWNVDNPLIYNIQAPIPNVAGGTTVSWNIGNNIDCIGVRITDINGCINTSGLANALRPDCCQCDVTVELECETIPNLCPVTSVKYDIDSKVVTGVLWTIDGVAGLLPTGCLNETYLITITPFNGAAPLTPIILNTAAFPPETIPPSADSVKVSIVINADCDGHAMCFTTTQTILINAGSRLYQYLLTCEDKVAFLCFTPNITVCEGATIISESWEGEVQNELKLVVPQGFDVDCPNINSAEDINNITTWDHFQNNTTILPQISIDSISAVGNTLTLDFINTGDAVAWFQFLQNCSGTILISTQWQYGDPGPPPQTISETQLGAVHSSDISNLLLTGDIITFDYAYNYEDLCCNTFNQLLDLVPLSLTKPSINNARAVIFCIENVLCEDYCKNLVLEYMVDGCPDLQSETFKLAVTDFSDPCNNYRLEDSEGNIIYEIINGEVTT